MPLFSYTARNDAGEFVTGRIHALSTAEARDELRKMHLAAEEIHETPNQSAGASFAGDGTIHVHPASGSGQATVAETEPEPPSSPTDIFAGSGNPPSQRLRWTGQEAVGNKTYFPLHETLRLYAGWLLAWYLLVYALGSYQYTRPVPFSVPLVEGLLLSPLVQSFTLATFLFLLLGSVHRRIGGGTLRAVLLTVLGAALFKFYWLNVG